MTEVRAALLWEIQMPSFICSQAPPVRHELLVLLEDLISLLIWAVMASYHLVFVLVTSIQAVKLDPYEAAMMDEETIANELLDEFYGDVYDLRPESKDFLPDDYFDLGGQPANTDSKDSPTFTEQVKKALMKSAKKKKTKSSSLQTTIVDSDSKNKDQNETETVLASIRPPSSRDPTFVLSRLLYHMAQLPTP